MISYMKRFWIMTSNPYYSIGKIIHSPANFKMGNSNWGGGLLRILISYREHLHEYKNPALWQKGRL